MEISVVVPAFIKTEKHLDMTIKCLELARANTKLPYELVIVETGTDYLKDYADVYIFEKDRSDIHRSLNRGLKCASGDFVCQLTNDVFVSPGWLDCLRDTFEKKPDCGIATLGTSQHNHVKEDLIREWIWFSLVMVRQSLFKEIGYFDEEYYMVWADTDFVMRTYLAGYTMYGNFNCIVDHKQGSTLYDEPGHIEAYEVGRKRFNEKFNGCTLPIFEGLR